MNEYEIMIKNLENRVTELEKRTQCGGASTLTVKKWQPKGGKYYVECLSETNVFDRETKAQAERAAVEMRRFNRLLALRDELCGDEDMDWGAYDEKYYVYLSHEDSKWDWTYDKDCQRIQPYFCSREEAQKVCDMLNSGEVEL